MAVTSGVIIARQALSLLGTRSSLESFTENSVEARSCKLWFDPARQQVLQYLDWSFARRTINPAIHPKPPVGHWVYRYKLPEDFIALRRIINPLGPTADQPAYELQNVDGETTLLTDVPQAEVVYTFDLDVSLFPPLAASAVVHTLAYYLSFAITGKADMRSDMLNASEFALQRAAGSDANQGSNRPERDAPWIEER